MRRVSRALLAGTLLLAPELLLAEEAGDEDLDLLAVREVAPEITWQGPQFLQATDDGEIYILRGKTLAVYPLEADSSLGKPKNLEPLAVQENSVLRRAAMSPTGKDWILWQGADQMRLFQNGKERPIDPVGWRVSSVAYLGSSPIVGIEPGWVGRPPETIPRERWPIALLWNGSDWMPLVRTRLSERPDFRGAGVPKMHQEHAVEAYGLSDGTFWLGWRYRHRLAHYSGAGRELLELEVDGAEVHHRGAEEVRGAREAAEARARRHPDKGMVGRANTGIQVVRGVVEGRDGRTYFLIVDRGGDKVSNLVLDRWDPVLGTLERVRLAVEAPGVLTVGAGSDGIYGAQFNGTKGRFMVPWHALEEARWTPVEGLELNGLEAEQVQEAKEDLPPPEADSSR